MPKSVCVCGIDCVAQAVCSTDCAAPNLISRCSTANTHFWSKKTSTLDGQLPATLERLLFDELDAA